MVDKAIFVWYNSNILQKEEVNFMIKSYDYIVCPNCGREYLVEEIFLPSELYSYDSINGVVRDDSDTKIIIHKGGSMNLDSTYTCENGYSFRVKGNLSFSTEIL